MSKRAKAKKEPGLSGYARLARDHWAAHMPRTLAKLERAGKAYEVLESIATQAREATLQMWRAKMDPDQIREIVLTEHIYIPPSHADEIARAILGSTTPSDGATGSARAARRRSTAGTSTPSES